MSGAISAITGSLGLGGGASVPGAPSIIAPKDFLDNIFGTSAREVDGPNGKQIVLDVNYSPEDQAKLDTLNTQYNQYLGQLQSLSSISSAVDIPEFQPVIAATRANQAQARQDAYNQRSKLEEEQLANRGLADSTAGTEVRQTRGDDLQKAAQSDENNVVLLAEQLRTNALQNTTNGLNITGNAIQQDKTNRESSANNLLSQMLNLYGQDNNVQNQNYAAQLAAYNAQQTQQQQIFQNLTSLAGGIGNATSGVGSSASSSLSPSQFLSTSLNAGPYTQTGTSAGTINWNRYGS